MKIILIFLVRAYKFAISPLIPFNTCRFQPTCSDYAIEALRKYNALKGSYLTIKRLLKCHPYSKYWGWDPVP